MHMLLKLTPERSRILMLLTGFSITSYIIRTNITIAGPAIMREYSLTSIQLGWIFSAFLFSYSVFMLPAGAWVDRVGPHRALCFAGVSWCITAILTAYLPSTFSQSTVGALGTLITLRIILGICQAPTFPSAGKVIAAWMPKSERAFANAIVISGSLIGSACTAPFVSFLLVKTGWREAMSFSSLIVLPLVGIWWAFAADSPRKRPATCSSEHHEIAGLVSRESSMPAAGAWKDVVRSSRAWRLFVIYGCECYLGYIFIWWFFIYLVEVRKFVVLRSGWATSLPFIVGAISTPFSGALSDHLITKYGPKRGQRVVPIVGLSVAAVFAFIGVRVQEAWLAILLLSTGAGLCWANEGPVWSAMISISRPSGVGAAGGFLNAGSNLGGALAAMATPIIAREFGWKAAFGAGSACSLIAALLWFGVEPDDTIGSESALQSSNWISPISELNE